MAVKYHPIFVVKILSNFHLYIKSELKIRYTSYKATFKKCTIF